MRQNSKFIGKWKFPALPGDVATVEKDRWKWNDGAWNSHKFTMLPTDKGIRIYNFKEYTNML